MGSHISRQQKSQRVTYCGTTEELVRRGGEPWGNGGRVADRLKRYFCSTRRCQDGSEKRDLAEVHYAGFELSTSPKSPCLLQQLSLPQSPILIQEAFRILAGPPDTSAPLVVLRVGEPLLAAEGFASSQERANGIEGCAIVIHCRCIVLL